MSQYRFTKTHEIDKDKFAELVVAAQGNRSLRSFAAACGVYASTLTRIIQKENKGASSPELIESIAENADPKSGVTIDMLADANGYSLFEVPSYRSPIYSALRSHKNDIAMIFTQELLDRGASLRYNTMDCYDKLLFGKKSRLHYDVQLITDAFCGEPQSCFFLFFSCISFSIESLHSCDILREKIRSTISSFVLFTLSKSYDSFSPPIRYSIVVPRRDVYDFLLDEFRETNVLGDISIVLVNIKNSTIEDEYMLPHVTYGHRPSYFMTTEPVINHQSSELYEDDFERRCNNEGNP